MTEEFNADVPGPARIWNYRAGGTDNFHGRPRATTGISFGYSGVARKP